MSEYIGNRIVPRHDGVWDKAKEYEPLTIVYEESTGDSYMSRKPVPAGTLLSQEEYWAMCSRFSEQMALYRQNTAEEVEQFRKDTAADVEQLRTDTASDVAALRKMTAQDVADITQKVDAANSAVAASKSEMDKTAEMLKAQINANVKVCIFVLVGIANIIDTQILQNGAAIRTAVVFFYLANEGLSCLENAAVIGIPVPEKLKEMLAQLKEERANKDE